mmetsp:Transcript_30323/g.73777  ORF Transcript_30323/g.73777 Transcript_30323/m.73777 type:complete len:256 (-) Transcript_30323:171-938(-)
MTAMLKLAQLVVALATISISPACGFTTRTTERASGRSTSSLKSIHRNLDEGRRAADRAGCGDLYTSSRSRRGFLKDSITAALIGVPLGLTSAVSMPLPAAAKSSSMSQEDIDKQNVVKGYKRLQYLLDNWEKETTVCGMGGDKLERSCDRTPLKVMDYMGYKATTDPLYKGEKTLRRLYLLAPADKDAEFVEAVEAFAENADEASGMAFISSWGEANPGGGKDRVELFIERAKKNVITARNSLETVIKILDLPMS